MGFSQMLYSLDQKQLLQPGELNSENELENALRHNMELLDSNWLVIGQQVTTRNGKRLDLFCMDRGENLIVVELKKDLTPREVTAQVIEYASYISELEPKDIAQIYLRYAGENRNLPATLDAAFLRKFGTEFDETQISQDPKMVIVAAKMDDGTEHIIKYLRQTYNVDINILFFQVFKIGESRILSRAWFEENLELEPESQYSDKWNREYYVSFGEGDHRSWEDARKYGFISAGGGKWYTQTMKMLHAGDRIWVYIPHTGYVGVGIVQGEVQMASECTLTVKGIPTEMRTLMLQGEYFYGSDDQDNAEYVVPVKWIKTVPVSKAVKETGFFGNQNTVCRPLSEKWGFTVSRMKELWQLQ